ncbi:MAG: ATP-binding cassette domain-containing protein [Clostridiales bacterium]|nr:ATP-binding cassette domain-containing protein [Clostridiales bacterium]
MLELKDIKKSYAIGEQRQLVLKGINVKFRKNEFTSILGSSGSGKTTLLNIIGGLDKYDSGDLIIDGISTSRYKDQDWDSYRNYRVGFIFQSYNLIMHQSILANVEMALTLSGVSKQDRKEKAKEALIRVGLGEHIDKKPNQLSGGQMQRVAIARALVNDPEIILADEPTGALDSATSVQIMDLLKEIAGDKLVIMVTHNPELARQYSSRIIELKDGLIINDSDPFTGDEEAVKSEEAKKTSMSLMTSLSLSFNNLLTKKGRTFMTAVPGSIGIIGIALILSLSNGINKMAKSLETGSGNYSITLEKTSVDLFGSLSNAFASATQQKEYDKTLMYSTDDIVEKTIVTENQGLATKNNLKELRGFFEGNSEFAGNIESVDYRYNVDLQVYNGEDYSRISPSDLTGTPTPLFTIFDTTEEDEYTKVLAGRLPENNNEIVLVLGPNNTISDSMLYTLGIKDMSVLKEDLAKIAKDSTYKVASASFSFDTVMGRTFKLILNTDPYILENGVAVDHSNDTDHMKSVIDAGRELTVVGVVSSGMAAESSFGYRPALAGEIVSEIRGTEIYDAQIADRDTNILNGEAFDGLMYTFDSVCEKLGIFEEGDCSSIVINPKDYEAKQKVLDILNKYNESKKAEGRQDLVVSYTDDVKVIIGGATRIVDVVSYVLIAFVAISLLVSSIMIAIITYISVLERTKEIGILRAIGASKKDITRVFRAETIIEGLISGVMGVVAAFILTVIINIVVGLINKEFSGIASMPVLGAIALVFLSVLLNVIAGSRPARMAAKKNPVEALRSE